MANITSGLYHIQKWFPGGFQGNVIQTSGGSDVRPVVMTPSPFIPPSWTIDKDDDAFTLKFGDGFASKLEVDEQNFVFTKQEGPEDAQVWELHPVLTKDPFAYYIRSAEAGQAWVVNGPESDQPEVKVELEDLGEVVIPEGPPDKFIFAITLA